MRFTPPTELTVWHSAGSILTRNGPLSLAEARSLVLTMENLAGRSLARGKVDGARYCRTIAIQVGNAVNEAARWNRAAAVGRAA